MYKKEHVLAFNQVYRKERTVHVSSSPVFFNLRNNWHLFVTTVKYTDTRIKLFTGILKGRK